jgi:hypothetical protein
MSTKAKATPKNATPAKVATKAKPAKTAPVVAAPEIAIKVLKKGSCTSLSDMGVLEYQIGSDEAKETYFRVVAKNAGGFFSQEWLAWSKIFAACNHCDWLTSIHLRSLFNGKSANTAGFLLAALMDQGLVQRREGKSRHSVARKAASSV